jgi:hypothetical protein
MHRRKFLAATLSSFLLAGAPAWAEDTNTEAARPIRGLKAADVIAIYNSKDSVETAAQPELGKQAWESRL